MPEREEVIPTEILQGAKSVGLLHPVFCWLGVSAFTVSAEVAGSSPVVPAKDFHQLCGQLSTPTSLRELRV